MAVSLAELIAPSTTAVITMEMQRGVCGDLASMAALADAVAATDVVAATATMLSAARAADVAVVHCTFSLLPDRAGTPMNAPLIQVLARNPEHLLHGSPAAELLPRLGVEPGDLVSNRHHGFSPFIGTDLDALLRARGVTTVVVAGVSLNLGIPGTVVEALNFGYRVVVARDCTVGVPAEYAESVLRHSLSVVATIATSADITAAWSA
jgi:nicotinamidase-related amidase